MHGHWPSRPTYPEFESKVLSQFLFREYISVEEIIDKIETGNVPLNYKTMTVVIKEKELKIKKARGFCKTTPPIRLWQTATEKNLADKIFKYIPTQTVTLSDQEIVRNVSDINDISHGNHDYVFMSMDFVRWCLSIGICLATPLFNEIDSLFGLRNTYKYTHIFPHGCLIIFQDRYRPPDGYDEPFETLLATFMGKKWMERTWQKRWTVLTIMIIELANEKMGTIAVLIGQGDNQALRILVPPPDELRRLTKRVYLALSRHNSRTQR